MVRRVKEKGKAESQQDFFFFSKWRLTLRWSAVVLIGAMTLYNLADDAFWNRTATAPAIPPDEAPAGASAGAPLVLNADGTPYTGPTGADDGFSDDGMAFDEDPADPDPDQYFDDYAEAGAGDGDFAMAEDEFSRAPALTAEGLHRID